MNKFLATVFALIGVLAFYGASFQGAKWHYGTAAVCAIVVIVCISEKDVPKTPMFR